MHKIFDTPEILDKIFSYSSRHTNTVTARVCQIWFARCTPFIWDTVKLNDILGAVLSHDSFRDFQKPLFPHSWPHRFFSYSKHIRHLECFDIRYAALTQVIFWRPTSTDLFSSRLTIIDWKGTGEHINSLPPLLTPTLKILHISMDGATSPDAIDALCKTIAICSPSLGALQMTIPYMHDTLQVSDSLCELVPLLPGLTSVSIPICFMVRKLFTILSRLPRLEGLLLSTESNIPYAKSILKREIIAEEETELPFRLLKQIYIYDNFGVEAFTLAKALGRGVRFLKLIDLHCSPCCENSDQIVNLMEWVYIACPNIQILNLSGENRASKRLPWQAIQALLQCRNLDTLKVVDSTIDMELEDIITVATNRSTWKVVVLPSSKALSYQALVAFAQNCPQLVELGLTLNAVLVPGPETDVFLQSLVTLDVGNSAITSQTRVVMFLSSICRNPLKINSDNQSGSWETVEDLVNSITARVRTLRGEIAKLRRGNLFQRRQINSRRSSSTFSSISIQTVEQEVETSFESTGGAEADACTLLL